MALNRYFNPVAYEGSLYAPPVEFIAKALDATQKQFDTNFAAANALKNQYIDALPQDRARADELQKEVASKIDSVVSKYSGDYSQATKDLYLLKSDIERKFKPGSEGYTIQTNYKTYNEAFNKEKERLAKGEITQQQFQALKNSIDKSYTGVKPDPVTGAYNPIQIEPLASYVDTNKIVHERLDKLKPREQTTMEQVRNPKTGMIELHKRTISGIDPNEAYNAAADAIMQDDKFQAYWNQLNRLTGTDPQMAMHEVLQGYAQSTIPAYSGIFKDAQDVSLHANPLQLEELRYRNKIRFDQYKRKQDQADMYDGTELSVLGTAKSGFQAFKPLPVESSIGIAGSSLMPTRVQPPDVDALLKSRQRSDVNYPLLKSIREANPSMRSSDVLRLYNENLNKTYGEDVYYTKYSTTKAQNEEADRVVPALLTGQVPLYEFDSKTGRIRQIEKASDRVEIASKFYNEKTRKATVKALGKSTIQTGHLPFGTVLAPEDASGKYYIAADTGVKMNQLNFGLDSQGGIRKQAFGFIQNPTQDFGEPFPLQFGDGSSAEVMGVKKYVWDATTHQAFPQVEYYGVKHTGTGGVVPDYNDPLVSGGRKLTPNDIEALLIPASEVVKRFPRNPISPSKTEDVPLESY